jgi:uncharacterized protein YkwD
VRTQLLVVAASEPYRDLNPQGMARDLEAAVNGHRQRIGLRPLNPHGVLAAAARQHSQRMRNLGFFEHTDPRDRTSAVERVRAVDRKRWALIAENLAAGQRTAAQAFEGWLDSPGHRVNLEHPHVASVGTAVVLDGPLRTYITQLYGNEDALAVVGGLNAEHLTAGLRKLHHRVESRVSRCIRR